MHKVKDISTEHSLLTSVDVLDRNVNSQEFEELTKAHAELLDKTIKAYEEKLNELKEAKSFIETGETFYLLENNDSEYLYVDKNNKPYSFHVVNEKLVLISEDFKMYEIIEYADMKCLNQDRGTRWKTVLWIDKVVKAKLIKSN